MKKVIVLFSGGLDSLLAVRILQEQKVEVEALNIYTPFHDCVETSRRWAEKLDVPLLIEHVADDYSEIIQRPRYGFGKNRNPCLDCRIYMCLTGKSLMERRGAELLATGEVAGQRPNSQKQHQLNLITKKSGLEGRLLRPLSAKLLPPTIAEKEGWIDRDRLYSFSGRGRSGLMDLAGRLGIDTIPQPSTGCLLTEESFCRRVHDLYRFKPMPTCWDMEVLKAGRQIRLDSETKIAMGRREKDNLQLEELFRRGDASESLMIYPESFLGPLLLLIGPPEKQQEHLSVAKAMILYYATRDRYDSEKAEVMVVRRHRDPKGVHFFEQVEPAKEAMLPDFRVL